MAVTEQFHYSTLERGVGSSPTLVIFFFFFGCRGKGWESAQRGVFIARDARVVGCYRSGGKGRVRKLDSENAADQRCRIVCWTSGFGDKDAGRGGSG